MKNFLLIEEYDLLEEIEKKKYKIIYVDDTNCIPYGYQLKNKE